MGQWVDEENNMGVGKEARKHDLYTEKNQCLWRHGDTLYVLHRCFEEAHGWKVNAR